MARGALDLRAQRIEPRLGEAAVDPRQQLVDVGVGIARLAADVGGALRAARTCTRFSSEAFWRTMPSRPRRRWRSAAAAPGRAPAAVWDRYAVCSAWRLRSFLVDAGFQHDVADAQDVGGLGFDLAGGGVLVLVVDPAVALFCASSMISRRYFLPLASGMSVRSLPTMED
jgi:hypothetical protein